MWEKRRNLKHEMDGAVRRSDYRTGTESICATLGEIVDEENRRNEEGQASRASRREAHTSREQGGCGCSLAPTPRVSESEETFYRKYVSGGCILHLTFPVY